MIGTIAGDKNAGDICGRALPGNDVTLFIHVDDAPEYLRVRNVPDGYEQPRAIDHAFGIGLHVPQPHPRNLVLVHAEDFADN